MPVTIDTSLPIHDDRDTPWDGDSAIAAMAASCGGRGETLNPSCMGDGFLWRDPDTDPNTIGAYKFPVANIFGGRKQIVFSALSSAASYLDRAKDIPESGISQMRESLTTLYKKAAEKFGDDTIMAPWEKSSTASAADMPNTDDSTDTPEDNDDGSDSGQQECRCSGCTCRRGNTDQSPTIYNPVIRASASDGTPWKPPRDWFRPSAPCPLTVTTDGRVYGDLARFDQHHIGADGKRIYPPRDPDGLYRQFRQRTIECDNGERIAVGVLTMDTGHADLGVGAGAAIEHYDNTGAIVAAIAVGEDKQPDGSKGRIWIAGSLLPTVDDSQRMRLMLAGVSGDWRQVSHGGDAELVAVLAVNVPGFPVPARPEDLALVAAGGVMPPAPPVPADAIERFIDVVSDAIDRRQRDREQRSEADAAARARMSRAQSAHDVMASCARRGRARRAQASLVAAVMTDYSDDDSDGDRDERTEIVAARRGRFLDSQGRNWVERTGGLPSTIRSVADHLIAKGFGESHAIATAVNVVKKWCWGAPDGLNWPGVQKVKPRTRARGCQAVMEWNLNRARARLSRPADRVAGAGCCELRASSHGEITCVDARADRRRVGPRGRHGIRCPSKFVRTVTRSRMVRRRMLSVIFVREVANW